MTLIEPSWDPDLYARFHLERAQPFHDLLARVPSGNVRTAADLGCGTGELTRTLCERWPDARVIGVDSSPAMLRRAEPITDGDRLVFVEGDLRSWTPPEPVDRIVSNAALQWVPGHPEVLRRLAGLLAPGGVLAVQMPNNREEPAYRLVEELLAEPQWSERVPPGTLHPAILPPASYLDILDSLGLESEAWETIYLHRLAASRDILEWLRGTVLRPVLHRQDAAFLDEFLRELGARVDGAYPAGRSGVLLRFRRFFFVARRPGSGR